MLNENQVLEQSGFLNEVGAAIHVAPNATRILRDWGCDFEKLQAVQCKRLQVWDEKGYLLSTPIVGVSLAWESSFLDLTVLASQVTEDCQALVLLMIGSLLTALTFTIRCARRREERLMGGELILG